MSIRAYVALWILSILISCSMLALAWSVTTVKLRHAKQQIVTDTQAVDVGHAIETALSAGLREDLLLRLTGASEHLSRRDARLKDAEQISDTLPFRGTGSSEGQLVKEIQAKVRDFYARSLAESASPVEQERLAADALLGLVRQYVSSNDLQLQSTLQVEWQIYKSLDHQSLALVVVISVLLAGGSIGLIVRVVRPTMELTRAASRFGQGEINTRVKVRRDDEMGSLCRTFNNMADDIAQRDQRRLQFMAKVAHDVSNPLVTIGGAARLLKQGRRKSEEEGAWFDRIIRQTSRLEGLMHDLMDTVQAGTGQLVLRKSLLDLRILAEKICHEEAEVHSTHRFVFEGSDASPILGDVGRLERVLVNLISNAVKYSPTGTTVTVSVSRQGRNLLLIVKDQGPGIAAEDLAVVFQPFGRSPRTQDMAKGTGLGLTVVKDIVEAHGGTVSIESQINMGTTLKVLLPSEG